jgi:LmbE family N-acetylglucosaminyl deacetylase
MAERQAIMTATADRLLAVFAHPDDESIVAGGTLAACAAAGVEVLVLCATRGEQGPIAESGLASRATLGDVRERELQRACEALGARSESLRFSDGDLDSVEADVAREIAARVNRWRPRAVLSFGRDGLYGHPDHLSVYRATLTALDELGDGAASPWLYQATWPEGHMVALVAAVTERGLPADLWGLVPESFGAPATSITTVVDVRAFLTPKLKALRSHRSQLGPQHLFRVMPADLGEQFLGREYFVRARPRDAAEDWLGDVVAAARSTGQP